MIPQVGGFQGCYLDNHHNNWRCARAVPALCENAPLEYLRVIVVGCRLRAALLVMECSDVVCEGVRGPWAPPPAKGEGSWEG